MNPPTDFLGLVEARAESPRELNGWQDVGFFGGTFDPPHAGHSLVIKAAQEALGLWETIVVPAGQNPLKGASSASYEDRLAMARLQFDGMPGVMVSDMERSRKPSYTYVSVDEMFMESHGPANYHIIIGDDCARDLCRWYKCIDLVVFADVYVVGPRAREARAELPAWLRRHAGVIQVETPHDHATQVREALKLGVGHPMLSDAVSDYIKERGLYR